jgi:hypothetical protein
VRRPKILYRMQILPLYGSRLADEISSTHSCSKRILLNRISIGRIYIPLCKKGE